MSPPMGLGLGLGLAAGGLSGGAVVPAPPGSPIMWLRADNVALGAVATWTDKTANGNSPTQATGTAQPVATAAVGPLVTLPALLFTRALSSNMVIAKALIGTNNYTIAVVGKVNSTAAASTFVSPGKSDSNGISVGVDINVTSKRDFNASGVVAISDSTNVATTNWEAWSFTSDASSNLSLLVNGVAHTLSSATQALATPGASTGIGVGQGSRLLDGYIFEIIVWATAQSNAAVYAYQHAITGL